MISKRSPDGSVSIRVLLKGHSPSVRGWIKEEIFSESFKIFF